MLDMKGYNPCLEQVYGFDNLPATFNHDSIPKTKEDKCNLCLTKFSSGLNIFKSKHKNCTKCGISVCEKCSLHKVQLCTSDETKHRICNRCYSKMQNQPLISFYRGLLTSRQA